jgi:hypothetical protein
MRKTTKLLATAFIILSLAMSLTLFVTNTVDAQMHDAVSFWVEPATLEFDNFTHSAGDRFNVTIWTNSWVNDSYANTFTWQVKLNFDTVQLEAANVWASAGATSEFFQGKTIIPVTPVINNVSGYIQTGESLLGSDFRVPGNGTLCIVEFEIMMDDQNYTSTIGLDAADTYLLDPTLAEIPSTKHDASYTYSLVPEPPDTTAPTIDTPTISPTIPDENDTVTVSVNVTDADSGVKNVTLSYTNNTVWYNVSMTLVGGLWTGDIPGYLNGTDISYMITAYDNAENMATNDNGGEYFGYTVIPEFTPLMLITLLAIVAMIAVVFRKRIIINKP